MVSIIIYRDILIKSFDQSILVTSDQKIVLYNLQCNKMKMKCAQIIWQNVFKK